MLNQDFSPILPVTQSNTNGQVQLTVGARQLHAALQVGRDFSTWFKGRVSEAQLDFNVDYFELFDQLGVELHQNGGSSTPRQNSHNRQDYYFTLDAAKEVAMLERNDIGKAVRKYFIKCEKELRNSLPIFTDPLEAAKAWVKAEEARRQAELYAKQKQLALEQEQAAKAALQVELDKLAQVTRELLRKLGLAGEYRTVKSLHWWRQITIPSLPTGKEATNNFWAPLGKAITALCRSSGGANVPYDYRPATYGEFLNRRPWDIIRINDEEWGVINTYPSCAITAFKAALIAGQYDGKSFTQYFLPNYKEILSNIID